MKGKYIPDKVYYHYRPVAPDVFVSVTSKALKWFDFGREELPNKPIHGARVYGTGSERGEAFLVEFEIGNKCYRGTIPDAELCDIIQSAGIQEGGVISEPLIWVGSGKYPKLTRVDSPTYKRYSYKEQLNRARTIPKKALIEGHFYESLGKKGIYLGPVSTIKFHKIAQDVIGSTVERDLMLWCEGEVESAEWLIEFELSDPFIYADPIDKSPMLATKRRHTYKVDHGKVYDVQPDIVERIRLAAIKEVKGDLLHGLSWEWKLTLYSNFYNMTRGEEPSIRPDVKELIELAGCSLLSHDSPPEELPQFLAHKNGDVQKVALEKLAKEDEK